MQSISKGYGTLSKQEFWEILERMVLPRLELLDAWEKEEIQAAFEGRELADDDEADKPEEAEEDDEFVVKTWDDFAKAESRLQVVAQLGLSRIDAEHDFAEKVRAERSQVGFAR